MRRVTQCPGYSLPALISIQVALDQIIRESSLSSSLLISDVHSSFLHFRALSILFPRFSIYSNFPGLQKSARSQILLHNSITLPLHGFSHIPISNIHYTKLPTEDFVRRERKKEGIIYDLLKFPFTSRIKCQHHSLLPFFQHQKKICPSSPTRIQ